MATLRPLLQTLLWRVGLASAPATRQPRLSDHSSRGGPKRKSHNWLGLNDLVPTQGSTSTTISGPEPQLDTRRADSSRDESVDLAPGQENGRIKRSVTVEQNYEGPPRLQLRDSLRNSLVRGSSSVYYADAREKDRDLERGQEDRGMLL